MMKKKDCEYLRQQAETVFNQVRSTWIECGKWALPHRIKWLLSQTDGARNNQHIVDATHILALRSYVAGFLEGNTSATRPWYRIGTSDPELNLQPDNHEWLDRFTRRTLQVLSSCNFYDAAGRFYYDYGVFNTGAYYVEELKGKLHFHNLIPGSYYVINNGYNEAVVLVRCFQMTVKALVDTYGDNGDGDDWANISSAVKKMYEDGNYTQKVDVCHIVRENPDFDPDKPQALLNRRWISYTYERGGSAGGPYYQSGQEFGMSPADPRDEEKFLRITASKRKPFIVGKSDSGNFEYGEKGPTLDALGLIKSLNKKAIGKDQALEHMLRPPLQGPANLKKSYITTAPNSYVPLDATSVANKGGLRTIFEVNPAIGTLIQDVTDLRNQVEKIYYSDYLLYLSRNPKTRTATETNAIVQEQQLIIGPNLQSLNWTHNVPVVEFIMDWVLFEDPLMSEYPPPKALAGNFLRPEFVSVFAQAQKAADLPSVDRYLQMALEVGQIQPSIWDKVNLDRLADLYEDRLFLPAGLNRAQSKVEAMREQAQAQARQREVIQQSLPAMAGAAKDLGLKVNNNNGGTGQ